MRSRRILALVPVFSLGCGEAAPPTAPPTAPPGVAPTPLIAAPPAAPAPMVSTIGAITVKATGARVDTVPMKGSRGPAYRSEDRRLMVALEISNASDTKKVDYLGWSVRDSATGSATLTDDLGNTYRRFSAPSFGGGPVGQLTATSIYPGKSVTDLLVFEPPVEGAREFTLELDAGNVGEAGKFRLKVALDPPDGPTPSP
jgi:hypothetical protein